MSTDLGVYRYVRELTKDSARRLAHANPPTLEQWVDDAVAVLDAAGSERAAIFGPRDSSLHAIMLRPD